MWNKTSNRVCTYQDNTHHENDHANHSSERNKVVREWKSKLGLEDHIGSVGQSKEDCMRFLPRVGVRSLVGLMFHFEKVTQMVVCLCLSYPCSAIKCLRFSAA